MVQPQSLGSGPLTAAVTSLTAPSEGAGRGDPAVVLAGLMDLRGSIELAHRLSAQGRAPASVDAGSGDARIAAHVRAELAHIAASVERTYADPFQRRNKLPSPEQVHEALAQTGALASRKGPPLAAAGAQIWAPFGELAASAADRVRFEAQTIRQAIAKHLRAAGPRSAQLERLDAALIGATAAGRARLLEALLTSLGRAFSRGLGSAVKALPAFVTPESLAPWFGPAGFLQGEITRGKRVVLGILAHERSRLEALAEAASGADLSRRP